MTQFTKTTDKQLIFYDRLDGTVYQLTPDGILLSQDLNSQDVFNLDMSAWRPVSSDFISANMAFCRAIEAVLNRVEGAEHPCDVEPD